MSQQQSVEELTAKLAEHRQSLSSVDALLLQKSGDETLLKLREDLETVIQLTRNLLNLRTKQEQAISQASSKTININWQVGDRCSAKWSQDQQWYSARISNIENGKYDVIFLDYGNSESGLSSKALKPEKTVSADEIEVGMRLRAIYEADGLFYNAQIQSIDGDQITVTFIDYNHSGQVSFKDLKLTPNSRKRSSLETTGTAENLEKPVIPDSLKILPSDTEAQKKNKKARIKAIKSTFRFKKLEDETAGKKSNWQNFHTNAVKKLKVGIKKESMFRSPDTVDGRVGVVGSGQNMTQFQTIGKIQPVKKEVSLPI